MADSSNDELHSFSYLDHRRCKQVRDNVHGYIYLDPVSFSLLFNFRLLVSVLLSRIIFSAPLQFMLVLCELAVCYCYLCFLFTNLLRLLYGYQLLSCLMYDFQFVFFDYVHVFDTFVIVVRTLILGLLYGYQLL